MNKLVGGCAIAALATLLGLAPGAWADDFPKRKAGLWVVTMSLGTARPRAMETKLCLDAATDQDFQQMGLSMSKDMCSRRDIRRDGDVVTLDSVCQFGDRRVTSHAVIRFTGDTSYHTDMSSVSEPPVSGAGNGASAITQDAKWAGPCPADMVPGDMITPNGMKMNIRSMRDGAK